MRGIVDAVSRVRAGFGVLLALMALCVMAPGAQADTVEATASAEVVVKRGHRGSAVRQIQSKLGIPADGVFGPQTERAVRRFQRSKGLLVDGVVGPQTRAALGLEPISSNTVRRRSHPARDRRMRVRRQPARGLAGRAVPRQVPVQPGHLGGARRDGRSRRGA